MATDRYVGESGEVADDEASKPTPLDLASVDSDWISATRRSCGVSRVRTRRTDKALVIHAYGGGGEPRPGDWGEVEADGVFALRSGAGYTFTATFDSDTMSSHLQTYQAHGIMSVHAFHRFTDDSGRRDYYTREFYAPATGRHPGTAPDARAGFPPALLTGANDPSALLGTWTVMDPAAAINLSALDCALVDGELTVRAYGTEADGRVDLGTTRSRLYADVADLDNPDNPGAFLATSDLGDRRVHVQARYYLGVLIAAQYVEFTDGSGRPDFYIRDAFRR